MRKIFITIPWFHPAFRAGGPVQSIANMVNQFNENISYNIFCGDTDLNDTTLENIQTDQWVDYNGHTQVWYSRRGQRSSSLVELVKKIKPDILFIIGIYSWHFTLVPLLFCEVPRKIVSVRGMMHPGAVTQKRLKKKVFLQAFRMFRFQKKFDFHATDQAEKKYIQDIMGEGSRVFVAGNIPRKFSPRTPVTKTSNSLKLISIALISPMKNHLLVLKAVEKCNAEIEYNICGPVKNMEYWQQCLLQIKKLPPNITVLYHGEVEPQQVELYVNKAHIFILPSKSENFGHAFYEALSAGKPVISSRNTPWNNLAEQCAGINVDLQIETLKDAILFFAAMTQEEYATWSEAAVNYAVNALDMEGIINDYNKMFFKPEVA